MIRRRSLGWWSHAAWTSRSLQMIGQMRLRLPTNHVPDHCLHTSVLLLYTEILFRPILYENMTHITCVYRNFIFSWYILISLIDCLNFILTFDYLYKLLLANQTLTFKNLLIVKFKSAQFTSFILFNQKYWYHYSFYWSTVIVQEYRFETEFQKFRFLLLTIFFLMLISNKAFPSTLEGFKIYINKLRRTYWGFQIEIKRNDVVKYLIIHWYKYSCSVQ